MHDCFDTTMWIVFCEHRGEDFESLTNILKALRKDKQRAFRSGDKKEMRSVQLKKKIREGQCSYRKKMEDLVQESNVSGV